MRKLAYLLTLTTFAHALLGCSSTTMVNVPLTHLGAVDKQVSPNGTKASDRKKQELHIKVESGETYVFKYPFTATLKQNGKIVTITYSNLGTNTFATSFITSAAIYRPSTVGEDLYGITYAICFFGGIPLALFLLSLL